MVMLTESDIGLTSKSREADFVLGIGYTYKGKSLLRSLSFDVNKSFGFDHRN